jgi:hypothetical protein
LIAENESLTYIKTPGVCSLIIISLILCNKKNGETNFGKMKKMVIFKTDAGELEGGSI